MCRASGQICINVIFIYKNNGVSDFFFLLVLYIFPLCYIILTILNMTAADFPGAVLDS
jgi:hypothetical protein